MKNVNYLIIGQIGSGKSCLTRHILSFTPRAIVIDTKNDYATDKDTFTDFDTFTAAYQRMDQQGKPFQIVVNPSGPFMLRAILGLVMYRQSIPEKPYPIGIFLDESSYYSDSHTIPQELEISYTKGRSYRINHVTVVQRNTQINPIIRSESHVWVALHQKKLSGDMKEQFSTAEQQTIRGGLQTLTPNVMPVNGTHYLTDTPDLDIVDYWISHLT